MSMRKMVVFLIVLALFALAAAPALAGVDKAPPGLHKAPAMNRANPHYSCLYCHEPAELAPHTYCARCHADPPEATCYGDGCHGPQ